MGTEKRARQKAGRAARLQQEATTQKRDQRKRTLTSAGVVLGIVLAVMLAMAVFNRGGDSDETATGTTTTLAGATTTVPGDTGAGQARPFVYGSSKCPAADGSAKQTLTFASAPANCLTKGKKYTATFDTTAGKVVVDLDTTKTPGTANNFVFLSRYHYYDNTELFRVAKSIDIIQGGSPHTQSTSDPGPGYTITDEGKFTSDPTTGMLTGPYTYKPGDLVMARSSGPDAAGAQFFFATGPNTANLDSQGTYVVFGHVSEGLDILQRIVATSADKNGEQVPKPKVTVKTVTIAEH